MTRALCTTACAACAALLAGGCEDKPRPWTQGEGPPVVLAPPATPEPSATEEAALPDAPQGGSGDVGAGSSGAPGGGAGATGTNAGDEEGPKVKPGGPWSRCYEGLVLSGDPLKDVTRLTLMCGPSNGMRRKARQAIVGLIGEREPPVSTQVRVARGACYRVFAVADAQVGDLDVTVRSSRGVAVAGDHAQGRIAIVQPDRPFCMLAADVLTMEVSARRGEGRFAAEVWSLGEARKKGETLEMPADEPPLDIP